MKDFLQNTCLSFGNNVESVTSSTLSNDVLAVFVVTLEKKYKLRLDTEIPINLVLLYHFSLFSQVILTLRNLHSADISIHFTSELLLWICSREKKKKT